MRAERQVLLVVAAVVVGCGGSEAPTSGPEPPTAEPRTYRMGWATIPPRPSDALFVATAESVAAVSEVVLVQEPVPWPQLLAGEPMETLLAEKGELADFYRGLGLELVWLVDPLDGLDRRRETPELVAAGRSLREPEIRALHREWVWRLAERTRPGWFGLASEINTLAARGDLELWTVVRDLVNGLAPEVRQTAPGARVFVSFQVDDPSQIPDDYFARFDEAADVPLALVEGGWASESSDVFEATPEEQGPFFRRTEELLDGVEAVLWAFLIYADLDLASLGLPPDRAEALGRFARMGVVDTALAPKPAHAVWTSIFERPLR